MVPHWARDLVIKLTRLNNKEFVLNAEMIETAESTPDTVVTLNNGHKHVVKESIDELIARVIHYKRQILTPLRSES